MNDTLLCGSFSTAGLLEASVPHHPRVHMIEGVVFSGGLHPLLLSSSPWGSGRFFLLCCRSTDTQTHRRQVIIRPLTACLEKAPAKEGRKKRTRKKRLLFFSLLLFRVLTWPVLPLVRIALSQVPSLSITHTPRLPAGSLAHSSFSICPYGKLHHANARTHTLHAFVASTTFTPFSF